MSNNRSSSDSTPPQGKTKERAPWGWLLMGFVITAVSILAAFWFVSEALTREPLELAEQPQPTIIRLTAPPTAVATPTQENPTPTPIPTFTPSPTPDLKVAPSELTIGFFAQVSGTDGVGLSVRGGSSTVNETLLIAPDETVFLILEGPVENNDFRWWQLQLADGTVGWAVDLFMIPASQPADWPSN